MTEATDVTRAGNLVGRVMDTLDQLRGERGDGQPAGAAEAAALVRATREALGALKATRSGASEAAPGRIAELRSVLHRILDGATERPVRLALAESAFADEWTDLLLEAVRVADFTVGPLFLGRARERGDRTLFLLSPARREGRISWVQAGERVHAIGRALLATRSPDGPVALLGANSPEIALFDLACLVTGTKNVPVPANSPPDQVEFILKHSRARMLFLGDDVAARTALEGIGAGGPERIHWLDPEKAPTDRIASFEEFLAAGDGVSDDDVEAAALSVKSSDVATVMYTSGTTGAPKGVPFTHENLVTKRFARAAAWPDIGEGDVFLCYLPLFHTFGRWLEMLGCVFWGSVYAFVDDVSVESLLWSFQRVRPTTFISVPKKWIQVAEAVAPLTEDPDPDPDRDEAISRELVAVTGGRLKRGLSAAGYLPPSVFARFHAAGIELHSGFGMTEATGGITMTPTGDYREDSIGVALPGIELKVAEDGELLIRGPYVTPPADEDDVRVDGWFASGDIVKLDPYGHLAIIDRKKEIFKNVQGETISPRRVESLFADFDLVDRVLLIGDRREFCTVLIVPSAELRAEANPGEGPSLESPELRELFAPLVSTVNRFLAPFERIVDFALLSRDLEADRGELTAKGTPRRKLVTERFKDVIEPMYSREALSLEIGGTPVRIPHWFLRQTGIHAREVRAVDGALEVATTGRRLGIRMQPDGRVRVGDLDYDRGGEVLRLGEIFGRAELWLGNEAAVAFAGPGIEHWWRRGRRFEVSTRLVGRPFAPASEAAGLPSFASDLGLDIQVLHSLARALRHPAAGARREVVDLLRESLTGEHPEMDRLARDLLHSGLADVSVRAECLHALLPSLSPEELDARLMDLLRDPTFPDDRESKLLARASLRGDQLDGMLDRVRRLAQEILDGTADVSRLERLVGLLLRQAIEHRGSHLRLRSVFATLAEDLPREDLRRRFLGWLGDLATGFRATLPATTVGPGVTWEDAVTFAADVAKEDRRRILDALRDTPLLAEAKTLLGPAPVRALRPLRAGSVRVRFLGTGTGRTVHLLEWFPAGRDENVPPFECIVKVNHELSWEAIQEELRLLVRARSGATRRPVVKTQGGGYEKYGLWTEEFIPGRTLDQLLEDLSRAVLSHPVGTVTADRVAVVWPFVVSSCASLVVDFWNRTGRRVSIANPAPTKLVLPPHDWQIGGRLVSVADRVPCRKLTDVLRSIDRHILAPLRERYEASGVGPEWPLLFSAALEVIGEHEGLDLIEEEEPWLADDDDDLRDGSPTEHMGTAALRFVSSVRRRGFLPGRLRHAARRYRRWATLNPDATLEAQAATLDQIEDAYGLTELEAERPGSRMQLFRHTVFRGAENDFTRAFDDLIGQTLAHPTSREAWRTAVAALREEFPLGERDEFFLARMLYPHVDPRGRAVLVREEDPAGAAEAGVEVEHRDSLGDVFRIRRPANPNETSALYRVFRASNFRRMHDSGGHDLLVVTDGRGRVIGGVIYRRMSETYVVLDWIVLSRRRRGRGIGSVLLIEFLERLRAQGVKAVSTGFFRPSFFSKFGFGVDPRYAGLVRFLEPDETAAPAAGS